MAFTGTICRFTISYLDMYDDLLLKEHVPRKSRNDLKEVNAWNMTVWNIMVKVQ